MVYNGCMESSENGTGRSRMARSIKITLIVLGVLLALLCVFLVRDYFTLRRENIISARELSLSAFVQKHGPLTADEVGVIKPWMTFDYVNKIFALPPTFLKDTFRIADPHYPNLAIDRYAGAEHFNNTDFVIALEAAIGNYLQQQH